MQSEPRRRAPAFAPSTPTTGHQQNTVVTFVSRDLTAGNTTTCLPSEEKEPELGKAPTVHE